jgi:hypothetical protein
VERPDARLMTPRALTPRCRVIAKLNPDVVARQHDALLSTEQGQEHDDALTRCHPGVQRHVIGERPAPDVHRIARTQPPLRKLD